MTLAEITEQLLRALPPGYAPRLGPDLLGIYECVAQMLKTWCADVVDQLRLEVNPRTCEQKLAEWESALGLGETTVARFGTTAQRRNQVIAKLRERGSLSIPDLRAVMQMFFGYADPQAIQVLETSRALLKAAHTYTTLLAVPAAIGNFPPLFCPFEVLKDDAQVGPAGAQLDITITGYLEELRFSLVGPAGTTQQAYWDEGFLGAGSVTAQRFMLYAPTAKLFGDPGKTQVSIAGQVQGIWSLRIVRTGANPATLHSAKLFVEGVGRTATGQGLGGAMYEFAVVADPALLGADYDLTGALRALQRIKPAYMGAAVMTKNNVMGGGLLAIPDIATTIPDASIPG